MWTPPLLMCIYAVVVMQIPTLKRKKSSFPDGFYEKFA
jgi:hypothetical protein